MGNYLSFVHSQQNNFSNLLSPISYRDGVTHQSILSSLSASYNGIGELSYYEDLAKNIDANLAEVDMESFSFRQHHEDTQHQQLNQHNQHNQLQDNDLHHHHQKIIRVNSDLMDNSICKSKQLFSPVKETISLSVDSLDLDGFREEDEDLILTCRANKNNYTIAFEGSQVYSEESYYGEIFLNINKFGIKIVGLCRWTWR